MNYFGRINALLCVRKYKLSTLYCRRLAEFSIGTTRSIMVLLSSICSMTMGANLVPYQLPAKSETALPALVRRAVGSISLSSVSLGDEDAAANFMNMSATRSFNFALFRIM